MLWIVLNHIISQEHFSNETIFSMNVKIKLYLYLDLFGADWFSDNGAHLTDFQCVKSPSSILSKFDDFKKNL